MSTILSLSSSARSSYMVEDRGNSYAHIVGGQPDHNDNDDVRDIET